ncbi:DUF3987 domain-containing protein [Botrimarina sp.]|uniref:DUF3987 domain-containing protein n=1 Tax=Botrimarina sp. TaxID=2795802 RepID=UPI0032EB453F
MIPQSSTRGINGHEASPPKPVDYALAYRRAGFSPIPIRTDGSKAPAIRKWEPYTVEPASEDVIRGWYEGEGAGCGVAIIHGAASGNSEIVDFDEGDLYEPFVETLEQIRPGLAAKLTVIQTPRPGKHVLYRCDVVEGNQKLAMRPPTQEEIDAAAAEGRRGGPVTLVETRGSHGYTLAPGTPGVCHPTGRQYVEFAGPPILEAPKITPDEREAIMFAARSLDQMPVVESTPTKQVITREWEGERPGDAYERVGWSDILEPHGWQHVGASGHRQLWRRPQKSIGVSATTGNVSEEGRDLLCVFSTNAWPFDGPTTGGRCSTHNKFDAFARLNHDRDHGAAAKELLRLGYGDKQSLLNVDPALGELPPDPEEPPAPPPEWRPFPTHHLPDPLRSLVQETAAAIGCDESMVGLPGLAICAGAIGATRVAQVKKGWSEPAILWCVLIHPSGGVKSQGRKVVLEPLLAHQRRARREYEDQVLAYESLQAEHKRDLKAWEKSKDGGPPPEAPEKPVEIEFITSDATIEGMIRLLNNNPRGAVLERDELAGWVLSFDTYKSGGGDAQNWIGAHGGDYMKVNRAGLGKSLYVPHAAVSVSGTVQPEILAKVLHGEHTHSGFAARLLMAAPPLKVKQWSEREVSDASQRRYAERFADLLDLEFATDAEGETYPHRIPLSPGARKRFITFVNEHGLEALDLGNAERAAHAKLEGYAARLALVMQLIEDPDADEISEDMITRGIELARWFKNEAARFYRRGGPDARPAVDERLVAWIEAKGGVVTPRDVQRNLTRFTTAEAVDKALDKIAAAKRGEWLPFETNPNGGPPTRQFALKAIPRPTQPPKSRDLEGLVGVGGQSNRETAFDQFSDGTDGCVPVGQEVEL